MSLGQGSSEQYDLILANPLYDSINNQDRGFQLGLLYISTFVKSNGYSSTILVGESVTSQIVYLLRDENAFSLIGYYVSADNLHEVQRSCRALKNLFPEIRIILGGPQARIEYVRLLKDQFADFVCIGEGEECTLELLNVLRRPKVENFLGSVPSLAYVEKDKVRFGIQKSLAERKSLDRFPIPQREDYDRNYLDTSSISTSRGCASRCTFCYEGTINKIRSHSVERVIDEMKYLRERFSTSYFSFVDDTFTTDRKRVRAICEGINRAFIPHKEMIWYCEGKVSDICKEPDLVKLMVSSGLARAQIGSESGNQEIIDLYKKRISISQITEAVDLLYEAGIVSIFTNFIIGGVQESRDTFQQSVDLAMNLMDRAPGVLECASTYLSPYVGTDIRNNPDKYGVELVDRDFITGSSDSYVFAISRKLSKSDVLLMGKEFYSALRSKMVQLYPTLSNQTIRNQLLASMHGLTSNWFQFLTEDRILERWIDFHRKGYLEVYEEPLTMDYKIIPVRCFDMESCMNSTLTWFGRRLKVRFNPLELNLMELASGKLLLSEILDLVYRIHGQGQVGFDEFRLDVIKFYNDSAENFLMRYRQFY